MFKRILVGVSGGVDSAVTALLLKNKGMYKITKLLLNQTGIFCNTNYAC